MQTINWNALTTVLICIVMVWMYWQQRQLFAQQAKQAQAETGAAQADIMESQVQIWRLTTDATVANLRADLETVRRQRTEEQTTAAHRQTELNRRIKELEGQVEKQQRQIVEQEKKLADQAGQIERLRRENAELLQRLRQLEAENRSLRTQIEGEKPKEKEDAEK